MDHETWLNIKVFGMWLKVGKIFVAVSVVLLVYFLIKVLKIEEERGNDG